MTHALVLGANGAIGRHTVAYLKAGGWTVAGLGHGPVNWASRAPIDVWMAGDISPENLDALSARFSVPDLIINLAGGSAVGPSLKMPLNDFERTVTSAIRTANWIWSRALDTKLVCVSSAAVYGAGHSSPIQEDSLPDPVSPYGYHKVMAEQAMQYWGKVFGVPSVIVRPFSVYGPGLGKQLIFDLCERLAGDPEGLTLSGTGEEVRDWVFIKDVAQMLVHLSKCAAVDPPIFNICSGQPKTVKEVAVLLSDIWGSRTKISFDGVARAGDPQYLVGSVARLMGVGLAPATSLEVGFEEVVKAARDVFGKG